MFSVPGWAVPAAALKMQTSDNLKLDTSRTGESQPTAKVLGKCKHAKKGTSHINSTNLASLWETVVEKKETQEQTDSLKGHNEKRRKIQGSMAGSQTSNTKSSGASRKKSFGSTQDVKALADQDLKKKSNPQLPESVASTETSYAHTPMPTTQLTPLQKSMRQKLISARFRHLNQTLYTMPSAEALNLFNENPEMFQEYHEGFRRQVKIWPENPVMNYVSQIRQRGKLQISQGTEDKVTPLPRTGGICHIADLGCGDAALATNLSKEMKELKIQLHSYDLQSTGPLITKADIASLPLENESIDIVIFCLALMGTNWIDFIEEACRILRRKGELWITEIRSRFCQVKKEDEGMSPGIGQKKRPKIAACSGSENEDSDMGIDDPKKSGETDVSAFIEVLRRRGFLIDNMAVDLSNKMFVKMSFVKDQAPVKSKGFTTVNGPSKKKSQVVDEQAWTKREADLLKPCVYKSR